MTKKTNDLIEGLNGRSSGEAKPLQVAIAGKGGVGKTTLAAILMKCLSRRGLRVLAVDADPTALLGVYLGVNLQGTAGQAVEGARRAVRGGTVARPRDMVAAEIQRSLVHTQHGDLLTMGALGGRGCYCAANSALRSALGEVAETCTDSNCNDHDARYDLLLVDCEPGLEIFSRGTLDEVDALIVVAEPTAAGFLVAAQIWQVAEALGLHAARQQPVRHPVLLNKLEMPAAAKRNALDNRDTVPVPSHLLGLLNQYRLEAEWVVPYDHLMAKTIGLGRSLSTVDPGNEFSRSINDLARHLVSLVKR